MSTIEPFLMVGEGDGYWLGYVDGEPMAGASSDSAWNACGWIPSARCETGDSSPH